MAGVLHTIARQMFGKSRNYESVRKPVKPAYDSTVRIKYVAPTVGPEQPSSSGKRELDENGNSSEEDTLKENALKESIVEKSVVEESAIEESVTEESALGESLPENDLEDGMEKEESCNVVSADNYEGKCEVGKDDYLLKQIDEFREKAQQLQNLLLSKESKVAELQNIVDEREGKAKELEKIVTERQKKADGIAEEMAKEVTAEITSQIDVIIGKVTAKLDAFGVTIHTDLKDGQKLTEQQYAEIKAALDETLPALNSQLDTLKTDLSDKVHSENVKCYRNVSDLIKTVEDKMDLLKNTEQSIERKAGAVQKCTIALIVLTAINMAGIAVLLFFQLSNFKLF